MPTIAPRARRSGATLPLLSALGAALAVGVAAPALAAQEHHHAAAKAAPAPAARPALLDGLGTHSYRITTRSALAQRFFDQGLRLAYAFNHEEALRSFREASRLDPQAAMAWWGQALVLGPNINAPMNPADAATAHEASRKALALASKATEPERALIGALAARYAPTAPADRSALDSAYADAMRAAAARFPEDAEIATLFAESLMDLRPWNYWDGKTPAPGTTELLGTLERVIARNPDHPGAGHLYIHAVEAAFPERAVASAERLAATMPAAGHIVHMPGHIYIRIGRYDDAIKANIHATHADERYIADRRPGIGTYTLGYYPHNYHFLAFAATLAGRSDQAVAAARDAGKRVPLDAAREIPGAQLIVPYGALTLATFGQWSEVLAEPLPPADVPIAHGLAQYARGTALAALGRRAAADSALAALRSVAAGVTDAMGKAVLAIATHALAGEIAWRRGELAPAIAQLEQAMAIEDGLGYLEPPYWHLPIRHTLGAVLLQAGRAADAERAYREDLERFPENGWSLIGLARSLEAQGRTAEATDARRRADTAWKGAGARPASSRY